MNAFDKWFSRDGTLIPSPGDAGYEGYVERKTAWQEALKWVLNDVACKAGILQDDFVIRESIRKEIQDGNT